jgi:hypothetical protein
MTAATLAARECVSRISGLDFMGILLVGGVPQTVPV